MNNKDLVLKQTNGMLDTLLKKESEALPKGFNSLRFKQNALTVLNDTNGLEKLQGNEFSLARTLMKGAYLGLDFFNRECYCIIYGNRAQFQTDYKGEIKLAKKYSINPIKDIYARLVREGDEFDEEIKNGQQIINFKPKRFNNSEIQGAFAVCVFKDGSMIYEAMSKEEIESVRNTYSKAKDSQAWKSSTGEMYKKTVLRRLCKLIELDFENIEQQKIFEEVAEMDFKEKEPKKEESVFNDVEFEEVKEEISFEDTPFSEGETDGTK